jgi:NADH-quinone oxidoreductase subunit E
MCQNILAESKYSELGRFIEENSKVEGALISVLHKGQSLFGYLPEEVQLYISRKMDIPAAKVNGVVSFYSYFKEEPVGENIISVCMGTACFVRGADKILDKLEKELGIKSGQVTADGKFSIDVLRCVGACGLAPVISIGDKVYPRLIAEDITKILEAY